MVVAAVEYKSFFFFTAPESKNDPKFPGTLAAPMMGIGWD